MTKVRIYTDGGSRGNPGEAGIGVYILDDQGQALAKISDYLGTATNNVAEYKAMLTGLQEASKLGAHEVEIIADSELMVKQMKGLYKVKNEGLIPLFQTAKALCGKFNKVTFTHVLREHNKVADQLANKGIDSKRGAYEYLTKTAQAEGLFENSEARDITGDNVKRDEMSGVQREILATGEQIQLVKFTMKQGVEIPAHAHKQEESVYVVSGKLVYNFDGRDYILEKGESLIVPSGKEHLIKVLEDTTNVNSFTPVRDDS